VVAAISSAAMYPRGLQVDYHAVWDFVHSEKLTYGK
jgi:transposase